MFQVYNSSLSYKMFVGIILVASLGLDPCFRILIYFVFNQVTLRVIGFHGNFPALYQFKIVTAYQHFFFILKSQYHTQYPENRNASSNRDSYNQLDSNQVVQFVSYKILMGNQPNHQNLFMQSLRKNSLAEPKMSNQAYGMGKVLRNAYDDSLVIEKQYVTDMPVWKYLESLQGKNEYIIDYIGHDKSKNDNFCSTIQSIYVYYEFMPFTLENLLQIHRENNQIVSESKLWKLLLSLVKVCCQVERSHRDIRPQNVLFSNDYQQVKYAPIGSFPHDLDAIEKRNHGIFTYLAPEYLSNNIEGVDWKRNDIFAAGQTMLDAMTLEIVEPSNYSEILSRIQKVEELYSRFLVLIVKGMLESNPEQRFRFEEIEILLEPFIHKIKFMLPFEIDTALIYSQVEKIKSISNIKRECFYNLRLLDL